MDGGDMSIIIRTTIGYFIMLLGYRLIKLSQISEKKSTYRKYI